jgi:hypothetical protein
LISQDASAVPVSEITRLFSVKSYSIDDVRSVERALQVEALPDSWKEYFRERLARNTVGI